VSTSEPGRVCRRRLAVTITVAAEARGEERGDRAVVREARLAARVPALLHPLTAPQDAVAPEMQQQHARARLDQPNPPLINSVGSSVGAINYHAGVRFFLSRDRKPSAESAMLIIV
jgi:hypothetical protein